jgi:hypothetical protein
MGSICYLIIIDGYTQQDANFNKAMTQLLTLFYPITILNGFKFR